LVQADLAFITNRILLKILKRHNGDVDILVEYPLTEPQSRRVEIDTMKEYNQLMLKWIQENPQPEIDSEESDAISDGSLKLVI